MSADPHWPHQEEAACIAWLEEHGEGALRAMLRRAGLPEDLAPDLKQQAHVRVLGRKSRSSINNVPAYCRKILKTLVAEEVHQERRARELSEDLEERLRGPDATPDDDPVSLLERALLALASYDGDFAGDVVAAITRNAHGPEDWLMACHVIERSIGRGAAVDLPYPERIESDKDLYLWEGAALVDESLRAPLPEDGAARKQEASRRRRRKMALGQRATDLLARAVVEVLNL